MGQIRDAANSTYSDGPTSNPTKPSKSLIRWLFGLIEDIIYGLPQGYDVSYETRAQLYADLNWDAGSIGRVFGDATEAYKGVYKKSGASGTGSWTRIGPLPGGDTSGLQSQVDALEADVDGKLDNSSSTNRVLGRKTSGTGAVEQLAPVRGLSIEVDGVGLADMPQATVKGRYPSTSTGAPVNIPMADFPVSTAQAAADAAIMAEMDERVPVLDVITPSIPIITSGEKVLMSLEQDGVEFPALSSSTRKNAVSDVIKNVTPSAKFVPLAKQGENVVLWLEEDGLGGPGLTREMRKSATSDLVSQAQGNEIVPLVAADGQVLLWLDALGINGPGLRVSSDIPAHSDGRSLSLMRSKIAQLRNGTSGAKLKVAIAGDSWAEMNVISGELRERLDTAFGVTGEGFQSVATGNRVSDTTLAYSVEWTKIDGSATLSFPYGAGPDGHCLWTASAVATLSITDLPATSIKIFHHKHGGTFRYRVDGGAWSTVTADSSGGFGVVNITGLSDTVHLFEMDTNGNAGIVSLGGFYTSRESVAGVELLKMGNGGLSAYWLNGFTQYIEEPVAEMVPDVAIVILGTNDYRSSLSDPQIYTAALADLAAAFRAAVPDIGLIFVAPPRTDGIEVLPLSSYRDALYQFCEVNGFEFLNLYDQFATYAQGNALGLWNDSLHVSPIGAAVICDILDTDFIHL